MLCFQDRHATLNYFAPPATQQWAGLREAQTYTFNVSLIIKQHQRQRAGRVSHLFPRCPQRHPPTAPLHLHTRRPHLEEAARRTSVKAELTDHPPPRPSTVRRAKALPASSRMKPPCLGFFLGRSSSSSSSSSSYSSSSRSSPSSSATLSLPTGLAASSWWR